MVDRALAGDLLSRQEAQAVLDAPDHQLLELLAAAFQVRRHYYANRVRLHVLLNAQSGLCPEDCHYCSQSTLSTAAIEKYPLLSLEKILAAAERAATLRAGTFCLVISGRAPGERVLGKVLEAVGAVKSRYALRVCVCLGLLTAQRVQQLKEAGVDQVNHNLNTSERLYETICTTHTFQDRCETVRHVRTVGLKACSGGILGMGESDDDVIDLALSLRALEVRSVPVNFLIPIPGTPLEGVRALSPQRCLRILCLYRFLLPTQELRIAAGRETQLRSLQVLGLYPANSMFIGGYLTTGGQAVRADLQMIHDAGFVLETHDGRAFEGDPLGGLPDRAEQHGMPVYPVV
jgi:biotin synthase